MADSVFAVPKRLVGAMLSIMLTLLLTPAEGVEPSPFSDPGTLIAVRGQNLPSVFEPSGIVWHGRLQRVLVVDDNGKLAMMDSEGKDVVIWDVGNFDLEAVTVANPESDFVYVGVEQNPISIQEFNLAEGQVTRMFDLEPWLSGYANEGLEGLTFVPDADDVEGGRFYVGIQATGEIHVFSLPVLSSSPNTEVTFVESIIPENQMTDLSGLYYWLQNDILYAIYDSFNVMVGMDREGVTLKAWQLPGNDQEGFAMGKNGLVYVAEDVDEVWRYRFARLPEANAGADRIVTDSDRDGIYRYPLNGSGSKDAVKYRWFENGLLIGTGVSPIVDLEVGTHTITLSVMNDDTAVAEDRLRVTVTPANTADRSSSGGGGCFVSTISYNLFGAK